MPDARVVLDAVRAVQVGRMDDEESRKALVALIMQSSDETVTAEEIGWPPEGSKSARDLRASKREGKRKAEENNGKQDAKEQKQGSTLPFASIDPLVRQFIALNPTQANWAKLRLLGKDFKAELERPHNVAAVRDWSSEFLALSDFDISWSKAVRHLIFEPTDPDGRYSMHLILTAFPELRTLELRRTLIHGSLSTLKAEHLEEIVSRDCYLRDFRLNPHGFPVLKTFLVYGGGSVNMLIEGRTFLLDAEPWIERIVLRAQHDPVQMAGAFKGLKSLEFHDYVQFRSSDIYFPDLVHLSMRASNSNIQLEARRRDDEGHVIWTHEGSMAWLAKTTHVTNLELTVENRMDLQSAHTADFWFFRDVSELQLTLKDPNLSHSFTETHFRRMFEDPLDRGMLPNLQELKLAGFIPSTIRLPGKLWMSKTLKRLTLDTSNLTAPPPPTEEDPETGERRVIPGHNEVNWLLEELKPFCEDHGTRFELTICDNRSRPQHAAALFLVNDWLIKKGLPEVKIMSQCSAKQ